MLSVENKKHNIEIPLQNLKTSLCHKCRVGLCKQKVEFDLVETETEVLTELEKKGNDEVRYYTEQLASDTITVERLAKIEEKIKKLEQVETQRTMLMEKCGVQSKFLTSARERKSKYSGMYQQTEERIKHEHTLQTKRKDDRLQQIQKDDAKMKQDVIDKLKKMGFDCMFDENGFTATKVGEKPIIIKQPPSYLEVVEDKSVTIECTVTGTPNPDITWYRDNSRIWGWRYTVRPNGDLEIQEVVMEDGGSYQCRASNQYKREVRSNICMVKVCEKLTIIKQPPSYLEVVEDQSVTIACTVTGTPDPDITWYRDNSRIGGWRYTVRPNGDLEIQKVVMEDGGNYECRASNKYKRDVRSDTCKVKVKEKLFSIGRRLIDSRRNTISSLRNLGDEINNIDTSSKWSAPTAAVCAGLGGLAVLVTGGLAAPVVAGAAYGAGVYTLGTLIAEGNVVVMSKHRDALDYYETDIRDGNEFLNSAKSTAGVHCRQIGTQYSIMSPTGTVCKVTLPIDVYHLIESAIRINKNEKDEKVRELRNKADALNEELNDLSNFVTSLERL